MDETLSRGASVLYVAAIATFISTSIKTAPYGRYASTGPKLPARIAWFLFESPNLIIPPCLMLFLSTSALARANATLLAFFLTHYVHRALIYPLLRMPQTATPMPIPIVCAAALFCCYNASLQSLALLLHKYPDAWLYDPRFIVGMGTAITGMVINIHSDSILLSLRNTGRYQIPYGALFRFVSCPNFFGETIEWIGWAIACWSSTAASFAFFTFCNTAPRAWSHHQYYRSNFDDYPKGRTALIPFLL